VWGLNKWLDLCVFNTKKKKKKEIWNTSYCFAQRKKKSNHNEQGNQPHGVLLPHRENNKEAKGNEV
jgi:hypothetical protein